MFAHADKEQGFITRVEFNRLAAALAASPTSEAEDQALLVSGLYTGALCAHQGGLSDGGALIKPSPGPWQLHLLPFNSS